MKISITILVFLLLFIIFLPSGSSVQAIEFSSGSILVSDKEAPGYRIRIIRNSDLNEERDLSGNLLNWTSTSDDRGINIIMILKSGTEIWLRQIEIPNNSEPIKDNNITLYSSEEIISSVRAHLKSSSENVVSVTLILKSGTIEYNYNCLSHALTKRTPQKISDSVAGAYINQIKNPFISFLIIMSVVFIILLICRKCNKETIYFASLLIILEVFRPFLIEALPLQIYSVILAVIIAALVIVHCSKENKSD